MEEKLIKTIDLKNGLRLEIYDSSRSVGEDRWQVVLTARIKIPVNMLSRRADTQVAFNVDDITSSIGENVCFEQKRERNFIGAKEKDEALNNLIDSFFSSSIDYVSNPDFPKRYIIRQYKEYQKRNSWYLDEHNIIDK
jgi:hypothetical protein